MYEILNFLKHPNLIGVALMNRTGYLFDDVTYLKIMHWLRMGSKLHLENPLTYSEKSQWLKLYDRNPLYTTMVDKYAVKKYVTDIIGEEYVVPALGVYDHFDDIDFDKLPRSFVMKCTHDSGSVVIVPNKDDFDREAARIKLEHGLTIDYFQGNREWPYKDVPRKILIEEYIPSLGKKDSIEYKLTTCNGEVKFITICGGIAHAAFKLRTNDHFTKEWQQLHWYASYKPSGKKIEKPAIMDKVIELSERLATHTPYLRVDWYVLEDKVYFGEMTFHTWGGFPDFKPMDFNRTLGDWIKLPR